MKAILWAGALGMMIAGPAGYAESGGNPWREVICYTKDSRNVEYSARGFRRDLNRVKQRALRVCQYYSERPSTCRLLRCRP